ncbi:MATE efflux family protein [Alloalcanivorax dieselolei B5]|uniref:MATE efflux family protein n=1 Tax=Alcanivorax dieselolei (strain DSM 16502 / CGMCC 1.3690 / MCCC 1A00001 / B-5) TaxID=930169 RepID=K0CDM3_ALCDB|nr:MATE family efflux transporter [Alloalcanivorax dieselolei]AFT69676.1 MATE efflux family protein [Alloalcanivorax dieselolei B5]GGK03186.1 MATE family efflux transporter [Alloalcanivorax dieselolei]
MNRAAVATVPLSPPPSNAGERARRILHAPVLPTLLKLALPNLVVMLAQALANFLESYYVGLIGVDALAGAALVFPLVMLMMMMSGGGIGGGISSAVARALGAGDTDKANALALHAVVITGVLGLLCSLVVIGSGPALYALLGGRDQALDAALAYSNALFAGVTFLWLMNGLSAVMRGAGNMLMPALVLTGGVLLLLVLSPLLIFGIGPLPGMGITGAGLALAAYYLIATVILAAALMRGHGGVRLDPRAPLRKALFAEILGVGLWSALNTVFSNLSVVVATFFVARTGMTALAGFGLGIRIEYLQIPLSFGFGTALVAMVGMNMGAGQIQRARRIAWIGAALTAATTGTVGLLAAAFPNAWLGLFTDDAEAIATGAIYLRTVAPVYGFFGVGMALYFASQGVGRMQWPIAASLTRLAVLGVGGALMTTLFPGDLVALCAVMAASLVALAAVNSIPWLIRR